MLIIAGISPRIKTIDMTPRRCPSCGLFQAHLKRTDSYLNLFFIPVIRIKTGEPFLVCDRCENREAGHIYQSPIPGEPQKKNTCKFCGQALEPKFIYCPYCGKKS